MSNVIQMESKMERNKKREDVNLADLFIQIIRVNTSDQHHLEFCKCAAWDCVPNINLFLPAAITAKTRWWFVSLSKKGLIYILLSFILSNFKSLLVLKNIYISSKKHHLLCLYLNNHLVFMIIWHKFAVTIFGNVISL